MSTYQTINCKCGHQYRTKEMFSNCPYCGKKNFTLAGGLLMILVAGFLILAVVVALLLFAGSFGLTYYARKNNIQNKWYYIGAIILGVLGSYSCYELITEKGDEIFGAIGLLLNVIGMIYASFSLYKMK